MKSIIRFLLLSFLFSYAASSQEETKNTIPGAKIYFSSTPFTDSNSGGKSSFKSSDFIYGRIELDGKKLLESFRLPKDGESPMYNKSDCYLRYQVTVRKDGEQNGQPRACLQTSK